MNENEQIHNESNSGKTEFDTIVQKLRALWADKRSYKKRLLLSGAAMLAACFTFIFFGPLELVAFSSDSLIYSYRDVIWLLLAAFLIFWGVSSALIALLQGKVFNYVVCSVFAVTFCGYLQSMFLNGSLGTLTGDAISWHNMNYELFKNIFIWLALLLIFFLIMYLHRKFWAKMVTYVSLLLVVMQLVPLIGIFFGAYDSEISGLGDSRLTTNGMYEYSENGNVFVFVLDRMDFDYVEDVIKVEPDFFNKLDGFTAYDNAISAFARTKPALNQLLTGCEELAHHVSDDEFYKQSWFEDGKDILRDLSAQDYTIEFYTDTSSLFSDADYMNKYVLNASDGYGDIIPIKTLSKLMNLSAFRYSPMFLKPFFWQDTNYYNQDVLKRDASVSYTFDDVANSRGFKSSKADREEKAFKLYHFNGPHAPYNIDKNGNPSANETSARDQLMGCMKYLYTAFDRMKELGIYEDATIIITADHGAHLGDTKPVLKETRIGLFYKPSGSAGTDLVWSSAPVCTDNIPATILKSAGADYSLYGRPLDEIGEDEEITRVYYKSVTESGSSNEIGLYTYHVTGDASDFNNWKIVHYEDISHKFY